MSPRTGGKGPGRSRCRRKVGFLPDVTTFKPLGVPMMELDTVIITHEELEAMRLIDYLGMDQESASDRMGISRRSFAGDLKSGRKKIISAFVDGKAVSIEGGDFTYRRESKFKEEE